MEQQIAEVRKIAGNPAPPTFLNTLVPLEQSGGVLNRVMQILNGVISANTNDALQHVQEVETPRLAAPQNAIYLDPMLFSRVEAIYNAHDALKLDAESRRLIA